MWSIGTATVVVALVAGCPPVAGSPRAPDPVAGHPACADGRSSSELDELRRAVSGARDLVERRTRAGAGTVSGNAQVAMTQRWEAVDRTTAILLRQLRELASNDCLPVREGSDVTQQSEW